MTGKLAVPIVRGAGGRLTVHVPGEPAEIGEEQLEAVEGQLRRSGFYPFPVGGEDEAAGYFEDPAAVERKVNELMTETTTPSSWTTC
jgi:hypothetical protein